MAAQLNDEQFAEIRDFFMGDTASLLFWQLEQGVISDWIAEQDPSAREDCWRLLQALILIKNHLQAAAPNQRLTARNTKNRDPYQA